MSSQDSGKVRVAVLFGGQSAEHDVSLRSAQTVMGALDPDRYEVVPIGVTRDGRWLTGGDPHRQLAAASPLFALGAGEHPAGDVPPDAAVATDSGALAAGLDGEVDVVFPVLHGPMGEDGTIQGMLELARLPYVGSGVLGSAVAMDKAMAKTVLAQAGLPQAPWRLVARKDWERDPNLVTEWIGGLFGFPCFVKPANMGSSVGVVKVHNAGELPAAMATAVAFDRRVIVEQAVDARELEVAVLGNDEPVASVAGEVVPVGEFYSYEAKYVDEGSRLIIPADLEGKTLVYLQELAIDSFRALDLAGLARADFFLERGTDHIYVNEVNTLPGFTSISMFPLLWEATGVPLPELVDRLIGLALERAAARRR
ncbi:MAG: D-alanine--D-alanine ligase [uncultured Thermomicrobiales bacterium]|uniref:D-alanine--D-alanine ligase n=1 Tax=uncultured Thermomicrobiales bacterium TaxID=1645740 RepID=A0A6J4VRJ7_9BACT|nr:MAG: D-alanine--D-alanine ligase [uncultured Thermomicrobiales bacterium]